MSAETGTPCTIRDAAPADAEAVAGMANALCRVLNGQAGPMTAERVRADLLGREGIGLRVAERDGRPVGYALWTLAYETAHAARGLYMTDLWVEPAHRRQGVARALVADLARLARAGGGRYVWWVSQPGNAGANAAYARLGAMREELNGHALYDAPFDRLAGDP